MGSLTSTIIFIESQTEQNLRIYRKEISVIIPDFLQDVNTALIKTRDERFQRLVDDLEPVIVKLEDLEDKVRTY